MLTGLACSLVWESLLEYIVFGPIVHIRRDFHFEFSYQSALQQLVKMTFTPGVEITDYITSSPKLTLIHTTAGGKW